MRPIFARPVEITAATKDFSVGATRGGAHIAHELDTGTYIGIPTVLYELEAHLREYDATMDVTVVSSGADYGKVRIGNSVAFDITWVDTGLRDLLGFDPNYTYSTSSSSGTDYYVLGTYTPLYCWFASHHTADDDLWKSDCAEVFRGKRAANGNMVGIRTGSPIYERTMDFVGEPAANVWESMCTTSAESARCLEKQIRDSLLSTASSDTSPSVRGFTMFYDISGFQPVSDPVLGIPEVLLGGTYYDGVWISVSEKGIEAPKPTIPKSRSWWNFRLKLNTAEEPTWTGPA